MGRGLSAGIGIAVAACVLATASSAPAATYSNPAPIAIPTQGSAAPYPSSVTVSGLSRPVIEVGLRLNGLTHPSPFDIGIALVNPTGDALTIMDCAGAGNPVNAINLAFEDQAAAFAPNAASLATTTYRPTNHCPNTTIYPAPGPADSAANPGPVLGGTSTFSSVFDGKPGNGTWSLYVIDGSPNNSGQIAGGWSLEIQPDPSAGGGGGGTTPPKAKKCKKPKKKGKKAAAAKKKKSCKKKK